MVCMAASASAEETDAPASGSPPSTVVKVTRAIKHGATAAVNGIKKGVSAGVHGVEHGAHAAASGVDRGAKATARGIEQGAAATSRTAKKVVRKLKGEESPAPAPAEGQ